jgi:hypothetical protein
MLLIDHDEAERLELHVAAQQPMRPDDDVDRPVGETGDDLCLFGGREKAAERRDPHGKVGEPVAERARMLLGENCRGNQHRDLATGLDCLEGGTDRDFGLPVPNVANEQAIHGLRTLEVVLHVVRRLALIGRVLEEE